MAYINVQYSGPNYGTEPPSCSDYTYSIVAAEDDFFTFFDPKSQDTTYSAWYLGGNENNIPTNIRLQRLTNGGNGEGVWGPKTNEPFGPGSKYVTDRFINCKNINVLDYSSDHTDRLYVPCVVSGRGSSNLQTDSNPHCYFLGIVTLRVDSQRVSLQGEIEYLTNIFDFSQNNIVPSPPDPGSYIDYKTSLFNIISSPSDSSAIVLAYAYRTTVLPFSLSYIIIDKETLKLKSNLDFSSHANFSYCSSTIYPVDGAKRTLSTWSDQNIAECLADNTKRMFYFYYDLDRKTFKIITFYIKIDTSSSDSPYSIDLTKDVTRNPIAISTSINFEGIPIGTLGVSGNGKVVVLNNHVLCIYLDNNGNYFATEVTLPLPLKNPTMVNQTRPNQPSVYNYYRDTSPIISYSGKYIFAIDYTISDTTYGTACGALLYWPVIKAYSYSYDSTVGKGKYQEVFSKSFFKIINGYDVQPDPDVSDIVRTNIGFKYGNYDPTKGITDPETALTFKIWNGSNILFKLGITDIYPNKDMGLTEPDNGLNGLIIDGATLEKILKSFSS